MKKVLSLLFALFLVVGCGGKETEEQKLFKVIGVEVKNDEGKEEENGIYKNLTFDTNDCKYSIIKNEEKEIVGFSASNSEKCRDDVVKLIKSDKFLDEEGIKEFEKTIGSNPTLKNAVLIQGYTIKVNKDDATILKEGIPKTTEDVVRRLKEFGMPIADEISYTDETDPNELLGRPNQYIEKTSFNDDEAIKNTLKKDGSSSKELEKTYRASLENTIELFKTEEDLNKRYSYLEELSEGESSILSPNQYLYKQGNFFLRITFDVTPTDAKKYEELFNKMFEEK